MATDVAETPAPLVDAAPEAPADAPAAPAADAKPAKAKKATAPKKRASSTHPPYAEVIGALPLILLPCRAVRASPPRLDLTE